MRRVIQSWLPASVANNFCSTEAEQVGDNSYVWTSSTPTLHRLLVSRSAARATIGLQAPIQAISWLGWDILFALTTNVLTCHHERAQRTRDLQFLCRTGRLSFVEAREAVLTSDC